MIKEIKIMESKIYEVKKQTYNIRKRTEMKELMLQMSEDKSFNEINFTDSINYAQKA